jgi:hypothetical protein
MCYGAHTLRIRPGDSLGTTRESTGTFYAVDFPGPDVTLGRPWRRDQGIFADSVTGLWRYGLEPSTIRVLTPKIFERLQRGSSAHTVRVCVAEATQPDRNPKEEKVVEPLANFVRDFEDVFESDARKMQARFVDATHAIDLRPGTVPPFQPLRNLSATELAALRDYLAIAEVNGWIRRSVSEAEAPILFAQKKVGSLGLCMDYCDLNDITVKDRCPLSETSDRLNGAQVLQPSI